MMNQLLDKFFRERLESHQKTAPASAWNKLEINLTQKNKKGYGFWLNIAASLLLMAITIFLLWPRNYNAINQHDLAQQTEKNKSVGIKEPITNAMDKNENQSLASANPIKITKIETRINSQTPQATAPVIEIMKTQIKFQNIGFEEVANPFIEETVKPMFIEPTKEEISIQNNNSTAIIYKAEEVNEKYLDKRPLAEATYLQKKPSMFKKLLSKAHALKNNQDPFGELRQKKNEILALNFTKDKRKQN